MARRCNQDGLPISPEDQATLDAFAAFLRDPTSRCPLCLSADHTTVLVCPEASR